MAGAAELGVETIDIDATAPDRLRISIPLATPEQLFYRRTASAWHLSTDPRALIRPDDEMDTEAIVSLMQFGAIVPPGTTHRPIRRLPPGRISVIDATSASVRDDGPESSLSRNDTPPGTPVDRLTAALDSALITTCPDRNPIVLFSGGVDSGVIAARIAKMGWSDALLLNYAMDDNDVQSQHAARMASELGLRFERIVRRSAFGDTFIRRIGEAYRQPFCDISSIPTMELADAAVARTSTDQPIIDGTGADGAFGLFAKSQQWERIFATPRSLRGAAAKLYDHLGLARQNGRLEYAMRLLARALHASPAVAAVAQSSLCSELFDAGMQPAHASSMLLNWLDDTIGRERIRSHLPALDLSLVCADRYAQKNKALFDAADRKVVYPFLSKAVVTMALNDAADWPDASSPKHTLKAMLTGTVSSDLVNRPKSGFRPPILEYLRQDKFQEALGRLIDEPGTLGNIVRPPTFRKAARVIAQGAELPATTISVVWTALVAHLWLHETSPPHPAGRADD